MKEKIIYTDALHRNEITNEIEGEYDDEEPDEESQDSQDSCNSGLD